MDPGRDVVPTEQRCVRPSSSANSAMVPAVVGWIAIALTVILLASSSWSAPPSGATPGRSLAPSHPLAFARPHLPGSLGPASESRGTSVPSASPVLEWRNISSETAQRLPVAWFTEGTWDAADRYLLYYGGDNFTGTNLKATEVYEAGNWTTLATTGTSPGPLDGPALAYDVADGYVVMYGGLASYSPFSYTNLTYVYSGGAWSSSHLNPTPPPRLAASMTYDPDLGGVVLFGGYNNSDPTGGTLLNDLWLYKGGSWSRLPDAAAPSVRTWASIAYDPPLREIVLYGGISASSTCYGDTWTYNGTWTHVTVPSGGPTGLAATALGYDPDLGAPVLTGGTTCAGAASTSTWTFNGSAWNALSGSGNPSPHAYGIAAWDASEQMFVVASGNPAGGFTDVLSTPLHVTTTMGPSKVVAGAAFTFAASVGGGVPLRGFAWNWGDGAVSHSQNATHVYSDPGVYPVNLTVTDATGASAFWNGSIEAVPGLAARITSTTVLTEVGLNTSFSGTSSGGSGTVTSAWSFGDGSVASGEAVEYAYAASGNFTVTLTVTDALNITAVATENVRVLAGLAAALPPLLHADEGVPILISPTTSGGDPPLTYAWISDDGATWAYPVFRHAFAAPGSHTVQLTVLDALNVSATAIATVVVAEPLHITIYGPTSVRVGDTASWTAIVVGGTSPDHLTWSLPDGSNGTGENTSFAFAATGIFDVSYAVTDAVGATLNASVNVTVTPQPSFLASSIDGVPTVAVLAAVVGVAAVGVLVWRVTSRRGQPPAGSG